MKFRLTYEGPLRPIQRDALENERDRIAPHKQAIRRVFHRQLKHLWSTDGFLRECTVNSSFYPSAKPHESNVAYYGQEPGQYIPLLEAIAGQYHEYGYKFVPLVCERWHLLCSLDILFLRRDIPGSVIQAGDLDNRIKTLIDALRRPRSQNELVGNDANPGPDEDPFFCLLEDDNQVSRLVVETDTLLDPPTNEDADKRKAHIVITVELRPYLVNMFNMSFS